MKTYTDAQLNEMKDNEPYRYFYYSHEEVFRKAGINLENEKWELPLLYENAGDLPDEKFARFYKIMNSENGVTMVSHGGDLVRIKAPEFKEEILANADYNKVAFMHEKPKPEPEGLGIGFYILRIISLGFYGGKRLKAHNAAVREHEESVHEYETAKADYEKKEKERQGKFAEHYEKLKRMGKSKDDVKAYMKEDKKKLDAEDAEISKYNKALSEAELARELRVVARNNLDFMMGQKTENAEEVKDYIIRKNYLSESAFVKSDDPEFQKNYLLNVDYPKDTGFSEHEIALFGFAATCCFDVQKASKQYPVPGGKAVMDDEAANKAVIVNGPEWYNFTESVFNRQVRNASAAAPLFNHAKLAACDALNKYKEGDCSKLGELLVNGLRYCSHFIMSVNSIKDDSTWVDDCVYAKEMLALANKDERIKESMVKAGFTDQDFKDANICSNIGDVYERGLNATYSLMTNPDLTPEEKVNAAAEIVELRAVQQMLIQHDSEVHNGPEYTGKIKSLEAELNQCLKDEKKARKEFGDNSPQAKKFREDYSMITANMANMPFGFLSDRIGYKLDYGEMLTGIFGNAGNVDKFHEHVMNNVDLSKFKTMDGKDIIKKLLPGNANSYVSQICPKDKEVKKEKNLENKKEMQDVKGNAMNN